MTTTTSFAALCLCVVAACGGSVDEPAPTPPNDSDPKASGGSGSTSTGTQTDPRLDVVCDGKPGLTGRAVLEQVSQFPKEMNATFLRYSYPAGPPAMEQPTPITLRFRYEKGEVRCTPAIPDPPGTLNPGVTPAVVTLDVVVELRTADGLFDETFVASFKSTGSTVIFESTVPVDLVEGSYRTIAQADEAGAATSVKFFGQMYPATLQYSYGGVVHGKAFGHFNFK